MRHHTSEHFVRCYNGNSEKTHHQETVFDFVPIWYLLHIIVKLFFFFHSSACCFNLNDIKVHRSRANLGCKIEYTSTTTLNKIETDTYISSLCWSNDVIAALFPRENEEKKVHFKKGARKKKSNNIFDTKTKRKGKKSQFVLVFICDFYVSALHTFKVIHFLRAKKTTTTNNKQLHNIRAVFFLNYKNRQLIHLVNVYDNRLRIKITQKKERRRSRRKQSKKKSCVEFPLLMLQFRIEKQKHPHSICVWTI